MSAGSLFERAMQGRRLRAFRVPYAYVLDVIVGPQGDSATYTICRMKPGLLPQGVKLSAVHHDPSHQGLYILVEHESFPVFDGTGKIPEMEFLIGELEVRAVELPQENAIGGKAGSAPAPLLRPLRDGAARLLQRQQGRGVA